MASEANVTDIHEALNFARNEEVPHSLSPLCMHLDAPSICVCLALANRALQE